jgi:D-galactarolactone cycloisomerase
MKITSIKTLPFSHRVDGNHPSRYLRGQRVTCLFLQVEVESGACGYGEVCDSFCCNYPLTMATLVEEALAPLLLGEDPLAVDALVEKMRRSTRRRLGDQGPIIQAISGVEIALQDLAGRLDSKPVGARFGARRARIPVYGSGSFLDEGPPEWHEEFFALCFGHGVKTIKLRMGIDYQRDLATLRGLRGRLPTDIQIAVDGGEYFTVSTALEISKALADIGVIFFEEPVPQCQRDGIARLVEHSPVPIAYGEHLFTVHDFTDWLAHGNASVVQPDAATCGGIAEAIRATGLADHYGIPVIPHCCAGPVSLAANLHFAAAVEKIPMIEYSFPLAPLWEEILGEPIFSPASLRNGMLAVPEGPGLGISIACDWKRHEYQGPSDLRPQVSAGGFV